MRLSTNLIFNQGSASISAQQATLVKTQQQLATGRRMLTPADDPVAATAALRTNQAIAFTGQHAANQAAATASLNLAESAVGSIGDLLQNARQLILAANNGSYTDNDRRSAATELASRLQELVGMANARDGAGGYLFAGFNDTVPPFALTAAGATYGGDDGMRELEVAPQRQMAMSSNGADMLMRIPNGNGVFAVSAGNANTGTGLIDSGRVANPAALTGHQYRIVFTAATTYDVQDLTTGTPASTGNAWTDGGAITIAGMQTAVGGQPAAGDSFDLAPSTHQSVFATLSNAIAALNSATSVPGGATGVVNKVNRALTDLDRAFDKVLTARTDLGARLSELDTLAGVTSATSNEHQRRLSELQDLDYAKAVSDLAQQQTTLQANQQTFAKVSKLSLFDFLG